jgi:hypothetical protein
MIESEVTEGQIQFVQNTPPAMQAGSYTLVVRQEVLSLDNRIPIATKNIFEAKKKFQIRGERFNLNPSDIDSIFPPDMSEGNFDDTFPHLVFANLTLPWERDIVGLENEELKPSTNGDQTPWLSLFLFDEDDPAPSPKRIAIKDLNKDRLPVGVWFPPNFELEDGEVPDDECTIIDIPKAKFIGISPSIQDMTLSAHGRRLATNLKIASKSSSPSGNYSVLIGNRLPRQGKESIVHLVSLEGYAGILKNTDQLTGYHTIRLVSLKNWRFSCKKQPVSFNTLLTRLNKGSEENGLLHFPLPEKIETSDKVAANLTKMGYLPLPYQMRQGYHSIALYRGPLLPVKTSSTMQVPNISQDELYKYDPDLCIFDLSYPAAWQLGQLLALQNKTFSQNLYSWKKNAKQTAIIKAEHALLSTALQMPTVGDEVNLSFEGTLNATFVKLADRITNIKSDKTIEGEKVKKPNPFNRSESRAVKMPQNDDFPPEIAAFIADLRTLNHVPFHYLLPDLAMLPIESLKLFYVDSNWINALVDGAMSLGNFAAPETHEKNTPKEGTPITGFIIRSQVLTGWPGMEILVGIKNESDDIIITQPIRMERLAPDIAICMVYGEVINILFREPGEGLHFGVDNENGRLTKKVRLNDGKYMEESVVVPVVEKAGIQSIQLSELYKAIQDKLPPSEKSDFGDFTTADFGYLMVEGVESVEYIVHL